MENFTTDLGCVFTDSHLLGSWTWQSRQQDKSSQHKASFVLRHQPVNMETWVA